VNQETPQPPPVAIWARVSAGFLALAGALAFGFMGYALALKGRWPGIFPAIQFAAAVWILPVFAIVAIRGRPPRYWPGLGAAFSKRPISSFSRPRSDSD
jgi:hypothetical protein